MKGSNNVVLGKIPDEVNVWQMFYVWQEINKTSGN